MKELLRNLNFSNVFDKKIHYTEWTIENAVKEGFSVNEAVYNSTTLIAEQLSSVELFVKNKKGEKVEHYINDVLKNPHPDLSRTQLFQIITLHRLLAGVGYLKKAYGSKNKTSKLYFVNPDRIRPISPKSSDQLIENYEIELDAGKWKIYEGFNKKDIIRWASVNPDNPLKALPPLKVLGKTVDIDNLLLDVQGNILSNGGNPTGIISFNDNMSGEQHNTIIDRIKKRFSLKNRGLPLVFGKEAKYQKIQLTPQEMDYLNTQKTLAIKIYNTYGIPLSLISSESMTYNNYESAMRILWERKILTLLNSLVDELNNAFKNELGNNLYISYDKDKIDAISDNQEQQLDLAKTYFEMGVPFSKINEKLGLNIDEFEGWEKSKYQLEAEAKQNNTNNDDQNRSKKKLNLIKIRSEEEEKRLQNKFDNEAEKLSKYFNDILIKQENDLFNLIDEENANISSKQIEKVLKEYDNDLQDILLNNTFDLCFNIASSTIFERDEVSKQILTEYINAELIAANYFLNDIELIQNITLNSLIEHVKNSRLNNETVADLKDRIKKSGDFSPERALRIARTEAGTFGNTALLGAGKAGGASKKIWRTGGLNVRSSHEARNGEKVDIDDYFSYQNGSRGKYPCDPNMSAADRVNCNCITTFE